MVLLSDPVHIRDEVERLGERLKLVRDDAVAAGLPDPIGLINALDDLLDSLRQRFVPAADEEEPSATLPPLGRLGDHGIDLLSRLADIAETLGMIEDARALTALTLPLACCVARGGGELTDIAPVVNAAAALANRLHDPRELALLYESIDAVVQGVSPAVSEAPANTDPARAWRLLLINRAIVATRSHEILLMEAAFDALIEQCPAEAPGFFREGMAQMDAIAYPANVRALMRRYAEQVGLDRRLH